jgi:uncharacterized circularly permuted ATP-grasp superfamily protein/uncharacterized alpha-E superfamily protein
VSSCAPETEDSVSLFGEFAGNRRTFDEVFSAAGNLRPVWQRFAEASSHLSGAEFSRRWAQAGRLLRQNSLAYPDPRDPEARRHPWALDALPLALTAEEWKAVSAGLEQRAMLLDMVLQDLYGPQRLLRDGLLPPEVVFRHPGFLLPYHRATVDAGRMLHLYAADLARSPDGQWWVLADRTEAPSGIGFALENRIALSRMLPDVIHQCRVERLAPFFVAMKRHIASLAPQQDEPPRIVLLSQAAGSANYFEDAFMARYLGYTLAEAGDLDVRDDRVYLKTLAGLLPVDVLWRRPNSDHCDPLELSNTSPIGVAGLLQAVRSGNVTIVNGLGSGLVESPVFMAFMPQLATSLLGEPLAMPGVATWWCGDPKSRRHVIKHIERLEIKHAYRRRGFGEAESLHISNMTIAERIALVESDPANYIAREYVNRSSAPVWSDTNNERAYVALRSFAICDDNTYCVMPGGLTRLSATIEPLELTLLDGEGSKDTWVVAEGPVPPVTLLDTPDEPIPLRRGGVELPSRAAEHFFWLGRHTARADALGKLVRATASRLSREEEAVDIPELPVLLRVLASQGQIEPGVVVDDFRLQLPTVEELLAASVFDNDESCALRSIVSRIVILASSVRDLLSLDNWRNIRQMDDLFWRSPGSDGLLDVMEKVDGLIVQLAAFSGNVAEGMTRTHAWRFLDFGRRLEHALQTVMLIRGTLGENTPIDHAAVDHATLEALLEVCDALMTYRSRYASRMQLAPVLDLLVTDDTNPRSVLFHMIQCAGHVEQLPYEVNDADRRAEHTLIQSMLKILRSTDTQELARASAAGDLDQLDWLLETIEETLPKLSDAISHRYFFHSGPTVQLGGIHPA